MRDVEKTIGGILDKQKIVYISSVDNDGFPNTKAMLASRERQGIKTIFFSGYTFGEKIKLFSGMGFSLVNVFHYVTSDNMFISSPTFEIPVYIVQGKYDYQVSHDLAQKYLSKITAPI